MALKIIKKIKRKAELETLIQLYDELKKRHHIVVYEHKRCEEQNKMLHEANLFLAGRVKQLEKENAYLYNQNSDLLLKSREKTKLPPVIRVMEVRTDGKAQSSNS